MICKLDRLYDYPLLKLKRHPIFFPFNYEKQKRAICCGVQLRSRATRRETDQVHTHGRVEHTHGDRRPVSCLRRPIELKLERSLRFSIYIHTYVSYISPAKVPYFIWLKYRNHNIKIYLYIYMKKWDYIYSSHNLIKNQNALILFLFLFVRFTVFFCFYFLPYIILNEVRLIIIIFIGCHRFDIMVLYYTLSIYILYLCMCTCVHVNSIN